MRARSSAHSCDLSIETDKSQSTSGTACSIPDIGTSNLNVINVAPNSMIATPAPDQKQPVIRAL